VDADEECSSFSDSSSDSGDEIQPETSPKLGGITASSQGKCDVTAVSDGSASSFEEGESKGAVENGQITTVETTSN
jgi:hypothetical protein